MSTPAPYTLPPSPQTNGLPVTVEDNINKALAATAGMTWQEKHIWFFLQVMPGGPMDYKDIDNYPAYQNSKPAQDFGNFNYGAIGTALGIPEEALYSLAGYVQLVVDLYKWVTDKGPFPSNPYNPDFFDNPGDQAKISEGITWSENNGYFDVNDASANAQGTASNDMLWISGGFLGLLNLLDGVTLNGGAGNDFIVGSTGSDQLEGGIGKDFLYGLGNDDFMYGDQGDDVLHGGDGTDWLEGGEGNDTLEGGGLIGADTDESGDTLKGGKGNDFLAGGKGEDTYIYTSGDGFDAKGVFCISKLA